jgi:proteasome-associated ATPase
MDDNVSDHESFLLEAEIRPLQGRVQTLGDDPERLLQCPYDQTSQQPSNGSRQHEKLAAALRAAKSQIVALKAEIDRLCAPPHSYGTFRTAHADGTVDVSVDGRTLRVNVQPTITIQALEAGQLLALNEAYNVVGVAGYEVKGEVVRIQDLLDEHRALVIGRADDARVVQLAAPLQREGTKIGDPVLLDPRSGYALERLPRSAVEEVVLEEVPDVTYDAIGGLGPQLAALRDAIELPYRYPEAFREHQLTPPKGILLYGPPGCGKTLIAKAVANSLARQIEQRTGKTTAGYFLNVKGPELLNKYVGETEQKIREVFQKARDKAKADQPVLVFFDEMDALFRLRGSGLSSDVEITVVAQLLAELDGLEALRHVIVIGATNRPDLIDPAVLRPGRLDLKLKIDRPDQAAARDIFAKYLTPDLPIHAAALEPFGGDRPRAVQALIARTVGQMYAPTAQNACLEVTYANGHKDIIYFREFASGAMIQNIVARAKKLALKRALAGGERGIGIQDLQAAVAGEYREHEDLPNTTDPDGWARISGRTGEKVVHVRTLLDGRAPKGRAMEERSAGQYL